jgi:MFS family permease
VATDRSKNRAHLTLALCVILHAFTHAYGVILVPLYLLMKADLGLGGVKAAALLVTLYSVVYNIFSFPAGVLADRFDRRKLLGIGLLGNALTVVAMGLTRQYELLVILAILAGLFGTLFHPAANALVCSLYPRRPAMAIGLLGIGSGLGFFAGPQFAGWRAQHAAWSWGSISQWQKPCIESGLAGLIFGLLFLAIGREAAHEKRGVGAVVGPKLSRAVVAMAAVLCWRDFAGVATISLASIYLQKACGQSVEAAGFIVGAMMLVGMIANPVAAGFTGGRRRLPALAIVCLVAGAILATTPVWPASMVLIPLCAFQTLQLGSYAISDSAMLERVAPSVRGRVVGIFLTVAGTWAGLSPWCMGWWTDLLGPRAQQPAAYFPIFATLGFMMWIASLSPLLIRRLGKPGKQTISVAEEIMPATMETVI